MYSNGVPPDVLLESPIPESLSNDEKNILLIKGSAKSDEGTTINALRYEIQVFDVLNENLIAYLNDSAKNIYRLPLIDGVYIPREAQVRYLNAVTRMSDKLGVALAIYGRPEFDTFTVRPNYTINTAEGRRKMVSFMREYIKMIYDLGGNACGNASEGRLLPICINQYRDAKQLKLDGRIKQIFDPFDIFNPGIKQEADVRNILRHFRIDYGDGIISEH